MPRLTVESFLAATRDATPPPGLSPVLLSLWHDARGDWHAAHDTAQDIHTTMGSRVHAYLHRKEGDDGNAAYWYRRAGVALEQGPLEDEWNGLVRLALTD